MKYLLFLLLLATACKSNEVPAEPEFEYESTSTPAQLGQQIFESKGNCYSCHQPEQKIIGPSLLEIASVYKEKGGDMVKFLRAQADPIVDPAQYSAMKVNLEITKRMSDEELQGLEAYILSHAK